MPVTNYPTSGITNYAQSIVSAMQPEDSTLFDSDVPPELEPHYKTFLKNNPQAADATKHYDVAGHWLGQIDKEFESKIGKLPWHKEGDPIVKTDTWKSEIAKSLSGKDAITLDNPAHYKPNHPKYTRGISRFFVPTDKEIQAALKSGSLEKAEDIADPKSKQLYYGFLTPEGSEDLGGKAGYTQQPSGLWMWDALR